MIEGGTRCPQRVYSRSQKARCTERSVESRLEANCCWHSRGAMHGFPERLHHVAPEWVRPGETFHLRIRVAREQQVPLTDMGLSQALLFAAQRYHASGRWFCVLFLLMPDHIHALVAFPRTTDMSEAVRNWKRVVARLHNVNWQDNYFDHRIRNDAEGNEKWGYIRRNPVVKGLCANEADWPHWWSAVAN
jgi:putative transposase